MGYINKSMTLGTKEKCARKRFLYSWCLSVNSGVSSIQPFDKDNDSLWQKYRGRDLQMRNGEASDDTAFEPGTQEGIAKCHLT